MGLKDWWKSSIINKIIIVLISLFILLDLFGLFERLFNIWGSVYLKPFTILLYVIFFTPFQYVFKVGESPTSFFLGVIIVQVIIVLLLFAIRKLGGKTKTK